MNKNPFAPDHEALPDILPIFPLTGVLLLPNGNLPLNIFEPRYLAMIESAMASHRMIGMIQPQHDKPQIKGQPAIFNVGCAGKITEFTETDDGRYLIKLVGISRFTIKEELDNITGFRQIKPDWSTYKDDIYVHSCLGLDRDKMRALLHSYFEKQNMECCWDKITNTDDGRLITCLSMACPFSPSEKQALLEAPSCKERAKLFMTMLDIAIKSGDTAASKH